MDGSSLGRDGLAALLALAGVFLVTVMWWTFALWPAPSESAEWLARARAVCFNAGPDGMPDVSGWLLLIGQPLGMFGFLGLVWTEALNRGLAWMWGRGSGRFALLAVALVSIAGLAGAGIRVAGASDARVVGGIPEWMTADEHPRMDQEAPLLDLVDHRGDRVGLESLRGHPAIVTFAFGHCPDICPLVVDNARRARDGQWGAEGASVVVLTLDPWRDTPSRLPNLAERWGLVGPRDYLLGGSVEDVEAVLDAWNVLRERDLRTGDVLHPSLTYLLDADGRIVFVTLSGIAALEGLAARL